MEGKASYLIVLCTLLMHLTVIGSDVVFFHTVNNDGILAYLTTQGLAYLLYPLLGWMADVYFTRYKFILLGAVAVIISTLAMILSAALFLVYQDDRGIFALTGVAIVIGLIGLGMFESTAIQFGMDQMPEASSRQLASFIQWYYWSCNVGQAIIMLATVAILAYFTHCSFTLNTTDPGKIYDSLRPYYFIICCTFGGLMAAVQLVCACTVLFLLICSKKHFIIDQAGKDKHPLKLIFRVLQYAWYHKCPERRSAFTYWEEDIPPRIDLGKSKYGGPFTTEEVEDTKTFFSILLLLFSLIGFHLSGHGYSLIDQLMWYQCPSHWVMLTLVDPMVFTVIIVIFGIPLYQLTKLCSCKYHPNMLKRMGLGLVCCFLNNVIGIAIQTTMTGSDDHDVCHHFDNVTADSCYFLYSELNITGQCSTISNATNNYFYCKQHDTAFLLLLVPKILQGFSFLLVFMTALEFICAQAPLRLKGLLIGLWYALLAINYLFIEIPEIYTIHDITWKAFHSVKTFFILLSLLAFLCVSRCYNYRLRDEVVQEQYLVEEIYEREFDLAEKYEQEQSEMDDSILIEEVVPEERKKIIWIS